MKAHEVVTFLLIFNLVIAFLSGIGVLTIAPQPNQNFTRELDPAKVKQGDFTVDPQWLGIQLLGMQMSVILAGVIIGAVIGMISKSMASSAQPIYRYVFAGFFWGTYVSTLTLLVNIVRFVSHWSAEGAVVVLGVLFVFTGVTLWSFIFGLGQMVIGGFRSNK